MAGGNPMALFDDVLKGGTFVNGVAIGAVALIGWPLARPLARPLAKSAIRGGIWAYRETTRLCDCTISGLTTLAKEAVEEAGGSSLAKKAVAAVGSAAAKEAVEEVGADIVEEAV
jgi:hypothetical protein